MLAFFTFLPVRSAKASLTQQGLTVSRESCSFPDNPSNDFLATQYWSWQRGAANLVPDSQKPKGAWVGIWGNLGIELLQSIIYLNMWPADCRHQNYLGCLLKIQIPASRFGLLNEKYIIKFENHSFRAGIGEGVIATEILVHQCPALQGLSSREISIQRGKVSYMQGHCCIANQNH